ncbi:hypothetical protein P9209_22250 [Prescottella defluvii]|nr:hypothetical protein P9209_22250 [Prescottella defluvii]
MTEVNPRAYNSMWQFRADSWCRLEGASAHLAGDAARGASIGPLLERVEELLDKLRPLERYWAFPGPQVFAQTQRLFTTGVYDKFSRTVTRINRALVTGAYRSCPTVSPLDGDIEVSGPESSRADGSGVDRSRPHYFEVLVVETMTDAQERALRRELRAWRRPDDQFIYELVVVGSGDDAVVAARLNANLQACVIRRRFSHQSRQDLLPWRSSSTRASRRGWPGTRRRSGPGFWRVSSPIPGRSSTSI